MKLPPRDDGLEGHKTTKPNAIDIESSILLWSQFLQ